MYLSPRSHNIVTTIPDGCRSSTALSAAIRFAPEEIPTKIPVSFANALALLIASSVFISKILSAFEDLKRKSFPSPIPCIPWFFSAGLVKQTFVLKLFASMYLLIPSKVPPVPDPWTKADHWYLVSITCLCISGAVVVWWQTVSYTHLRAHETDS